jgi:hypothetical protein
MKTEGSMIPKDVNCSLILLLAKLIHVVDAHKDLHT